MTDKQTTPIQTATWAIMTEGYATENARKWLAEADQDGVLPAPPSYEVEIECLDAGLIIWRDTLVNYRRKRWNERVRRYV